MTDQGSLTGNGESSNEKTKTGKRGSHGKLTKVDYQQFAPMVEKHINTFHKIRMVFEMKDFHGWETAAQWQDLKFDAKHFRDIERLALVGDRKWEKGMSIFCKPFTSAKTRCFDASDTENAYKWIREDK